MIDVNTGILKPDRLQVLTSSRALIQIGWARNDALLLDFIRGQTDEAHPFFGRAEATAQALDKNDRRVAEAYGLPRTFPAIADPEVRRMAIAEALVEAGFAVDEASTAKMRKASPDDPQHPGWPAGTPGGLGGKYRPKDGEASGDLASTVTRIAARRNVRNEIMAGLRAGAGALLADVPFLGWTADALMFAATISDFTQLQSETDAAFKFLNNAPWGLDDLRVSPDAQSFASFDAFKKIEDIEKRFGPAPDGFEYHHIVEQGGANAGNIPADQLQSTDNIIRVPSLVHEAISAEYSRMSDKVPEMTNRQWLQTQPFDVQYEWGVDLLKDMGVIR